MIFDPGKNSINLQAHMCFPLTILKCYVSSCVTDSSTYSLFPYNSMTRSSFCAYSLKFSVS